MTEKCITTLPFCYAERLKPEGKGDNPGYQRHQPKISQCGLAARRQRTRQLLFHAPPFGDQISWLRMQPDSHGREDVSVAISACSICSVDTLLPNLPAPPGCRPNTV
jgi:hypothetical protein